MRRNSRLRSMGGFLLAALVATATATTSNAEEDYPTKPIALVVTFAAGGGTDVLARLVAKYLGEEFGQPVNVINKPGGDSIPGILSVLNAEPDGYTLLVDGPATSSLQALKKDLPYKLEDRTWGPGFTAGPFLYAVDADSPWQTLGDVAKATREDPESFRMAWLGGSSFTDTTTLKFLDVAGVDARKVRKVPFTGAGPAMVALAGGHIDFAGGNIGAAIPLLKSGDVRVLAVSGDRRIDALPDVPSSKEAGFHVPLTSWNSLSGPPGMPDGVLDRIDRAVQAILENREFVKELNAVGSTPRYTPPQKMWPAVEEEIRLLQELMTNDDSAG